MRSHLHLAGMAVMAYRRPDGSIGWQRVFRNGVTIGGVNWLQESGFRAGTQAPNIYAGLIASAGFTAVNNTTDTHSSHPGWVEWTSLASATRPIWQPSAANGGLMGTLAPAVFLINADGAIKGSFLTTIANVGSTAAGVLYNTAVAQTELDVEAGGTLDVSFAVRLTIPVGG